MDILIFTVILLALIVYLFLKQRNNKKRTDTNHYEKKLTKRCLNDHHRAERLIDFELKRHPKISREKAAKNALEALLKDIR
ncbi:MAG TPA: hypothetical protein EYH16_00580 [Leucothrix mucor]|nr:hypothetical protein [Leucothrix mucor]